jgi:hypothetical protein
MLTQKPRDLHAASRPALRRPAAMLACGILVLLGACSSGPMQPLAAGANKSATATAAAEASDPWASNCYKHFERDVLKLAGEQALDCGLLRLDATEEQRASADRCARVAEASKRPYRTGQVGIDVADTYIACDVAIRDPSGQRWRLWYDFDLDDRLSKGASDGVVSVSRCDSIAFRPGSLLTGSFFELGGCEDAPYIVASPIAAGAP